MKNLDFIAVGEIAVDVFIRLKEATLECDAHNQNCKLCVAYGAKIPFESAQEIAAVGNAGNAAVSAARLGLQSGLVANVGKDANGQKCLDVFAHEGVVSDYISTQEGKDTNYHYILWFDKDRTILQKHSNFEYRLPDIGNPKWIYLTSLGEHSLDLHRQLISYLETHPDVKLAFQPGIFQIKFGKEILKEIYKHTEVFFCNVEEAQQILSVTSRDVKSLMKSISALGPKYVFLTDGFEGAYAYDGTDSWFMPIYPHEPVERTGAGDAFASTIVSALALGLSTKEAIQWGPINSMSVVSQVGAQKGLLTRERLEEYLKHAPQNYTPEQI